MGFQQVLNNLTFKHVDDFEEKDSVSCQLCFELVFGYMQC